MPVSSFPNTAINVVADLNQLICLMQALTESINGFVRQLMEHIQTLVDQFRRFSGLSDVMGLINNFNLR